MGGVTGVGPSTALVCESDEVVDPWPVVTEEVEAVEVPVEISGVVVVVVALSELVEVREDVDDPPADMNGGPWALDVVVDIVDEDVVTSAAPPGVVWVNVVEDVADEENNEASVGTVADVARDEETDEL